MRNPAVRFGVLVAVVALLAAAAALFAPDRAELAAAVEGRGALGPALAVVGTTLLIIAMVPRTWLAAAGGLLFGLGPGAVYVLAGALLGASGAFAAGRLLGRDFIDGWLAEERAGWKGAVARRFARADTWLGRHGIVGVLTIRLLPIAPYGLMSYIFGTSATRYRHFLAGSALGATPSTIGYAALGAAVLGSSSVPITIAALTVLGLLSLGAAFWLRRSATPADPT